MEDEEGTEGRLFSGLMLVPWASWEQWNFVRKSLFSSSPDAVASSLRRITAWQGRGCLPVAVEVTASIIEIRHKDHFFSKKVTVESVNSDDMLVMLYSMAITRFINGFVQKVNGLNNFIIKHAPEKKRRSIVQLADAIGIPRMLVDIRHESSHGEPPSLPLLRIASTKALDWLKCHYWEAQRMMIPDARKETRSTLRQMVYHIKAKHDDRLDPPQTNTKRMKPPGILHACNKLSSKITGKLLFSKHNGSQKHISKYTKIIARLYSVCPMEVVSSLLGIYTSQVHQDIKMESDDDSNSENPGHHDSTLNVFKAITTELTNKIPSLVLSMLKEVFRMIEAKMHDTGENTFHTSENHDSICQVQHLSYLVSWLVIRLKALKNASQIQILDESQPLLSYSGTVLGFPPTAMLRECLFLSASGNKHLSNSAMILAEMFGNKALVQKFKKLLFLSLNEPGLSLENSVTRCNFFVEEKCLNQAVNELEFLRSRLKRADGETPDAADRNPPAKKRWRLAKSWTVCPIGMLPCPYSSTALLPPLDKDHEGCENKTTFVDGNKEIKDIPTGKREARESELLEDPSPLKKLRQTPESDIPYLTSKNVPSPMEGMLLIDGVRRHVGEDEILAIESNIRILVK